MILNMFLSLKRLNFVPLVFMLILSHCYKVLRDGRWNEEDAAVLVPGDVVSIKLGDIIPADARLLEGDPLKIDQVGIIICYVIYLQAIF